MVHINSKAHISSICLVISEIFISKDVICLATCRFLINSLCVSIIIDIRIVLYVKNTLYIKFFEIFSFVLARLDLTNMVHLNLSVYLMRLWYLRSLLYLFMQFSSCLERVPSFFSVNCLYFAGYFYN